MFVSSTAMSLLPIQPAVKFTEHVITTNKPIPNRPPRLLRIIITDADATDSSSDDEDDDRQRRLSRNKVRRVKRHIREINLGPSNTHHHHHLKKKQQVRNKPGSEVTRRKKFRGVRQRPWGRWAAEIRDPNSHKRLWLGTFDTPEEAAVVYDKAAVMLKGPNAVTNFPHPVVKETETETETEAERETETTVAGTIGSSLSSPTSVLCYDNLTPFEGLGYGQVDAFGLEIDMPVPVPVSIPHLMPSAARCWGEEEVISEFDVDDFLVDFVS
ncbi:hypothetical protein SLEP1_g21067 [Rubroshorea leprosula]|uniref:AP2/ERF domain-containing protein n=1 Tax=Rubroshorea leprosula TaxID=152421 RepID=A0AAV5J4M7_9ROSI|nr:hypothetical protein SLEP1_g21067 [Rubroshorea leprosula]